MPLVTFRQRVFYLLAYILPYYLLYILPNLYPLWPPTQLPMTAFEQAVPFLPFSFLIYISDYLLVFTALGLIQELVPFQTLVRHIFGVLIVCGVFFIFFPTTYPRPNYPELEAGIVRFAMHLVGGLDTPNNCFPSHHVAITSVAAWSMRLKSRRVYLVFLVWSLGIFVSTLTTKQHYLADILGGLAAAALVIWLDHCWLRRAAKHLP